MSKLCDNPPGTLTDELDASESRLALALDGVRKAKPAAAAFFSTLTEQQRDQANNLIEWPGLM